jgi:hypothetical protein
VADADNAKRTTLCLVADDEVIERFPAAVRYLQIGLLDDADVLLAAPEHPRAESIRAGPTEMLTYRTPRWPLSLFSRAAAINGIRDRLEDARRDGPVLIHGLSLTCAPTAAALAAALECDWICNVAAVDPLSSHEIASRLRTASRLVVPGGPFARALEEHQFPAELVRTIRPGVVSPDRPAAFRREADAAPTVCYAGPLVEAAGVALLLHATKAALRHHPRLLVFIIGKGPAEFELRRLAESLDLAAVVTFTGRLDDVERPLGAADIFCVPRALSAFREEPLIALAQGLALVADEDLLCDGLLHDENSLLFADDDADALATHLLALLDDHDRGRRLGQAAQALARSGYPVSGMVSGYLDIYRELASRRSTLKMPAVR